MPLKELLGIVKDLWALLKRPQTAFLMLSLLFIAGLDALWSFHGPVFSIEAIALLTFSGLFLVFALVTALRRPKPDDWRSFLGATLISLLYMLTVGGTWQFYLFPLICALTTACLVNKGGTHAP